MSLPASRSVRTLTLSAFLAAALTACPTPQAPSPDGGTSPDAGGPPDAGAQPPDAGPGPVVEPPWTGLTVRQKWMREGLGEAFALQAMDTDEDGSHELIVGGRGLALVGRASREGAAPLWSVDWVPTEHPLSGGDNTWVASMATDTVNDDALHDVIALNSEGEAYAVDLRTGQVLWRRGLQGQYYPRELVTFTADAEGTKAFFPAGGRTAYASRDGSPLWTASALPDDAIFVRMANLNHALGNSLIVITEEPGCVNNCPPPDPEAPLPLNVWALGPTGELDFSAAVPGNIRALTTGNVDQEPPVGPGPLPTDEAIVGTTEGKVHAVSADGVLWSTQLEGGWVDTVGAQDLDFDGRSEVFAATSDIRVPGRLHALSREGQLQWSVEVGKPVTRMLFVDVDQDGGVELVLATGVEFAEPGEVLAVRLGADVPVEQRILWRHALPLPAQNLTLGTVDGQLVLLMGAMDARVHALVPATGEEAWTYGAGSFVMVTAAGDVDGDGLDEVVRGDDQGLVSVHAPASGHALWTRRVEAPGGAAVTDVATGDLDGDGKAEVVVSGTRFGMMVEPSLLQAFRADGSLLFSRALPSWTFELAVADLDGDGRSEVLVSEGREDGGCGIRALAADGEPLWRTRAAPTCDVPTLDVGHADGDDLPDVGYADLSTFSLRHVALLAADGTLLWSRERFNDGLWVRVVRGGLVYGGWAEDAFGHVTRVEARSGEVEWEQLFEPFSDSETPGIPNGSGAQGGALVADRDGDGVQEVVVGTHSGQVHLLDGASGEVKWTRTLTHLDAREIARHSVGAGVAWVPATGTQPSYVAVGLHKSVRSRAELHVLRTDTGAPVGRVDTSGNAYAACVGRFTAGAQAGVAFGGGLSVYALEVAPAP